MIGVNGAVSALLDIDSEVINTKYLQFGQVPCIMGVASSAALGDGGIFKYKANTNAIVTYEGMVFQYFACSYWQYTKFVIFASFDIFGSKTIVESSDGTYCDNLERTAIYNVKSASNEDTDLLIARAKETGANVFFLCLSEHYVRESAYLLEKGYETGLFQEGTQVVGTSQLATADLWKHMSPGADVAAIMKGFLVLKYAPHEMMTRSKNGLDFIKR
jgi:hypothetical protein